MKKISLSLAALSLVVLSCTSDNDEAINPDNNQQQDQSSVEAPATYKFEKNGQSSVSYSGQTTRIAMAEELMAALKNNAKTEAQLKAMFAHEEGNADFDNADLNASGKNIKSKTAASEDFFKANTTDGAAIKLFFDTAIKDQVTDVFPNWAVAATAGTAGNIQEAGGGSTRYVNGKGVELNQLFGKSLIGALMTDQILNNYLSSAVLDAGTNIVDNDKGTLAEGKNYTTMEHKWDEAFGYLYGADNAEAPELGKDSFLNKYLKKVEADSDFAGIAKTIYDAFKLGRAAIVAKKYDVRDQQAEIIRAQLSKVIAVRTVYYLQAGKAVLAADKASAFHDLSEGIGFLYSLQFTRKPNTKAPYFTKTQVDAYVAQLLAANGFWDVTGATLDSISTDIATAFGFTVEQAAQ